MSLEEGWPPRKDHVATYRKYQEMRLCAETELAMLLAKRQCVGPTTPNRTRDALEVDIQKARQYLSKLDSVMDAFAKSLTMLSRSRGSSELALFAALIVKGRDPKTVSDDMHLSLAYVYKMQSRFRRELSACGLH